jgi:hypothetical protein
MNASTRWLAGAALVGALVSAALAARANAPAGRYTVTTDTVLDTQTGLTWEAAVPSTTYTWGSASTSGTAQNYCSTLAVAGGGWRLPTMKELMTIVDDTNSPGTPVDSVAFPNTPADYYWSSTPFLPTAGQGWAVRFQQFNSGGTYSLGRDPTTALHIRCVR